MREAKRPYSPEEWAAIRHAADALRIKRRSEQWVGKLVRVLYYTGWHLAVLYDSAYYAPEVRGAAVSWKRPKTREDMEMPMDPEIRPWLAAWLEEPRPRARKRYFQILEQVGKRAGVKCNALRFRHSCAVYLGALGFRGSDIQRMLGVTPKTLLIYVERPMDDLVQEWDARVAAK